MPFPELQFSALTLGLTLMLLAVAALIYALTMRRQSGLPSGHVIYSDTDTWHEQSETLFDKTLQLAGKPDYLVQSPQGEIIPVEVKSTKAPRQLYDSHILQLAAYCRLVQMNFGQRPTYGIIKYQDKAFEVDYTADLEDELFDIISFMREDLYAPDVGRVMKIGGAVPAVDNAATVMSVSVKKGCCAAGAIPKQFRPSTTA